MAYVEYCQSHKRDFEMSSLRAKTWPLRAIGRKTVLRDAMLFRVYVSVSRERMCTMCSLFITLISKLRRGREQKNQPFLPHRNRHYPPTLHSKASKYGASGKPLASFHNDISLQRPYSQPAPYALRNGDDQRTIQARQKTNVRN
jgi:hypothetical protein